MSGPVYSSNRDTSLSDYFLFKVVFLKSLKKHPTKKRLYGTPSSVSLRERIFQLAGHSWRNKSELVSDTLLWNLLRGKRSVGRRSVGESEKNSRPDDYYYLMMELNRNSNPEFGCETQKILKI